MAERNGSPCDANGAVEEKRFKIRLKSTKNLCLEHRFFDNRQIHRFFMYLAKSYRFFAKSGAQRAAQLPTHRATSDAAATAANRGLFESITPQLRSEEIENCGNDSQNNDGGVSEPAF